MTKKKAESLFTRLMKKDGKVIDAVKRPLVNKKNRRALESAFESAIEKKVDAELLLAELRQEAADVKILKSEDMTDNVQKRINAHQTIKNSKRTCEIIKTEYLDLFGVEMDVEDISVEYSADLEDKIKNEDKE